MAEENSVSEEMFYSFRMDDKSIAGMTRKNAGNFYSDGSSEKTFELAKKVLEITGFYSAVSDKFVVMRAEKHGDEVIYFPNNSMLKTTQLFCDGVIYRGIGATIFFPGGCPAISFRDIEANLSGMLHGGWKPITKGIVKKFLDKWEVIGGKPQNTAIKFLPSICDQCLEYESEYFYSILYPNIQALLNNRKIADKFHYSRDNKKIHFLLNFLIVYLLEKSGYNKISAFPECTCGNDNGKHQKYWCYRHDDKDGEKYRNSAFIITL
jgi:copper oxidase (laccase) domain-containing protein